MGSLSQSLGRYASQLQTADIPEQQLWVLRCAVLYAITCAMADHGSGDVVQTALPEVLSGAGPCDIVASASKRSSSDAAGINAALMTARSQSDTHPDTGGHLGCIVVPAVFALAQELGADSTDIVAALAVGFELPALIARKTHVITTSRGFRGTPLYGVFGAAAACARLMRLDESQAGAALSIAANFASGLTQCFVEGTPEAVLQVAHASRAGLFSARTAAFGIEPATHIFEGEGGFYKAYAGASAPMTPADLPAGWSMQQIVFKQFPGCIINQNPVRTLLALLRRCRIAAEDIQGVTIRLNPNAAAYPGIAAWGPFSSKQGAIMSAPFMAQVAIENGTVRMRDFLARHGDDPIHERSRRVRVESMSTLHERYACEVQLLLKNGERHELRSEGSASVRADDEQFDDICKAVAQEWYAPDTGIAFDALRSAVHDLVLVHEPGALDLLFRATHVAPRPTERTPQAMRAKAE